MAADECLEEALVQNPANQEARFLRAVARLLRFVEDQQDGPNPDKFTDSLGEMLDQFGFSRTGRSLFFDEELFTTDPLPVDSPTGGDIQEFLRDVFVPILTDSIDDSPTEDAANRALLATSSGPSARRPSRAS